LLNADDLDAMWVCLRENCVIDDATGAEKVCHYNHVFFSYIQILIFEMHHKIHGRGEHDMLNQPPTPPVT
jgi:hypothetical protein